MTFDDLPYVSGIDPNPSSLRGPAIAAEHAIVSTLRRNRIPATGFVNEDKVEALGDTGRDLIGAWNSGLLELGNHGYSHFDSNALSVDDIEGDILRGATRIGPMAHAAGRTLKFFRFPYNHVGDSPDKNFAIETMLQRHGYTLAATTIDNEDYLFNSAYECAYRARNAADMARIREAYLDYTRIEVAYYQQLDHRVVGYDVPAIMLLHTNRLNAFVLPRILNIFREQSYRFVTLSSAQSDPAFADAPAYTTRFGPMWGYRWAHERHIAVDGRAEQEPPGWIGTYCAAHS